MQTDDAVDRASASGIKLAVAVLDGDLVPKEACRLGSTVGDQRLDFGQFQLERVAQELPDVTLDRLGLVPRSRVTEQEVG